MLRYHHAVWTLGTLSIAGALGAWGCGGDDAKSRRVAGLAEGCSLNSQCDNPLVCTFEKCHKECERDRDCPGEARCVKGTDGSICQLDEEVDCKEDSDCPGKQVCGVDGSCRDKCDDDGDCPVDGQVCANSNQCASTEKDEIDDDGNIVGGTGTGGAPGAGGKPGGGGASVGGAGNTGGVAGDAGGGGNTGGSSGPDGGTGGASSGGAGAGDAATGDAGTGGTGVVVCGPGTKNCDSNPSTCESIVLTTACGDCTTVCDGSHAKVKCDPVDLVCVIDEPAGGCDTGFDDCDAKPETGCEAELAKDVHNCGKCKRDCGDGASCSAGKCGAAVVMDPAESASNPTARLFNSTLYCWFTSGSEYHLRSGGLTPVVPPFPGDLKFSTSTNPVVRTGAWDADYLYMGTVAAVSKKKLDGSGSTTRVFTMRANAQPNRMTVTSTAFYLSIYEASKHGFYTAPLNPANPDTTFATAISGLDSRPAAPDEMLVAGGRLYWLESNGGTFHLFSSPLAGGTVTDVASNVGGTGASLRTDDEYVYWTEYGAAGRLRRVLATDATPAVDVIPVLASTKPGIGVDTNYVYVLDNNSVLYRAKKDGTEEKAAIATLAAPSYWASIAFVDNGFVYGIGTGNSVYRITATP